MSLAIALGAAVVAALPMTVAVHVSPPHLRRAVEAQLRAELPDVARLTGTPADLVVDVDLAGRQLTFEIRSGNGAGRQRRAFMVGEDEPTRAIFALTFTTPATITIAAPGPCLAWAVVDLGGPAARALGHSRYDAASGAVIAELSALSVFAVQAMSDPSCADAGCPDETLDAGVGLDAGTSPDADR